MPNMKKMKRVESMVILGVVLLLGLAIAIGGCNREHKGEDPIAPGACQFLEERLFPPEAQSFPLESNAVILVDSCGGQSSPGNPYPCCSNGGNCTWWAWKMAKDNWGVSLPGWGNANTWATYAQSAGYPVSSTPAVGTIGVSTGGTYGHVVWVTSVGSSTVTVTEMNCCTGCAPGVRTATYNTSYFNAGYIYRKNSGTEVIVDDLSAGFAKYGTPSYWQQAYIGYNGHMYWTYSNGSVRDNYARWTPSLPGAGTYTVSVYIPSNYATSNAPYKIYANGTTYTRTVNQNNYYNAWVSLGSFYFSANGTEYVELADNTGESPGAKMIGFDAVKWVK